MHFPTLATAILEPKNPEGILQFVHGVHHSTEIRYADLRTQALAYLGVFQRAGVQRGDELLIVTDDNPQFVAALWAGFLGGIVPVPVATPTNEQTALKILRVAQQLRQPWILSEQPLQDKLDAAAASLGDAGQSILERLQQHAFSSEDCIQEPAIAGTPAAINPDDLAFIQFSSGSTGEPKGVMLTHYNLLDNIDCLMGALAEVRDSKRFVSWMPLTHDLGIIFFHLMPVVYGYDQCLIPTRLFGRSPPIWMHAVHGFRGTITGGPNYAFRHVLKHLKPREARDWDLSCLRYMLNAAEPISASLTQEFIDAFTAYGFDPQCMAPSYGLAEATLGVSMMPVGEGMLSYGVDRRYLGMGARVRDIDDPTQLDRTVVVQVGCAIPGVEVQIADLEDRPLPENTVGSVYVRSAGVMQGYYQNPKASAAALRPDGWLDTGDLGFLRAGRLVITGRRKDLVIINGVNYYPHDLERIAAEVPGVDLNMVVACAVPHLTGDREALAIFILYRRSLEEFQGIAAQVRDIITRQVGISVDYCLPVTRIPKTTSGKLQRFHFVQRFQAGAFADLLAQQAVLAEAERAGLLTPWTQRDAVGLQAALLTEAERISPYGRPTLEQPLMDAGFTSARLLELLTRINTALGLELPVPFVFEHPSVAALSEALLVLPVTPPVSDPAPAEPHPENAEVRENIPQGGTERLAGTTHNTAAAGIAIIGAGCRLPHDCADPETFWAQLLAGQDLTGEPPSARQQGLAEAAAGGWITTQRAAYLQDIESFDPRLFHLTPIEAEALDPQQRLLLMVTWEALERAGILPDSLRHSRTGVFVGLSNVDYLQAQQRAGDWQRIGPYAYTGTAPCMAAGRLSFVLGLQGPSLAIDTACSSGLVALHQAIQSLRQGEIDLAIVAAANLILNPEGQICLTQLSALAPDGRCKTFSAQADGYARGEGAITVLLQRQTDAVRDGHPVLALVRGSAVNHDGPSNGLTAPNGQAQRAVLAAALADAGIAPNQVGYLETHGTGTALGDPIEVEALAQVYAQQRSSEHPLYLGAVKSNIGHLEAAAGLAGVLKVVLGLQHGQIPASLHAQPLSPRIPWAQWPLQVVQDPQTWPADPTCERPALAGVSAFGMSGTNAHVLLEAAPAPATLPTPDETRAHLLLLSARSQAALQTLAQRWASAVQSADPDTLRDLVYTALCGRQALRWRLSVVGTNAAELASALPKRAAAVTQASPETLPPLIFAIPGQGSQLAGMGRTLAQHEPVFRTSLEQAARILKAYFPQPLTDLLFAEDGAEALAQTALTQVATVVYALALSDLLQSWGLRPAGVIGHSSGEIAAAVIAGVMDRETGLLLAAERGRLMQKLPTGGAMAAVSATVAQVEPLLSHSVNIAAYNSPNHLTLTGERSALERVLDQLREQGCRVSLLPVSHAFHSTLMDSILPPLEAWLSRQTLQPAQLPLYSTLSGRRADPQALAEPAHWLRHVREPVRFAEALQSVPEGAIFVELGARASLMPLASVTLPEVTWLPCRDRRGDEPRLLETVGVLFELGLTAPSAAFLHSRPGRRIAAPTHPFLERVRVLPSATQREAVRPARAEDQRGEQPPSTVSQIDPARPEPVEGHGGGQPASSTAAREALTATLLAMLKSFTGLNPEDVDPQANWFALGLDSLMIVQLQQALNREYQLEISLADIYQQGETLNNLLDLIMGLRPELLDAPATASPPAPNTTDTPRHASAPPPPTPTHAGAGGAGTPVSGDLNQVLTRQIEAMSTLFAQQLQLLGAPASAGATALPNPPASLANPPTVPAAPGTRPTGAPAPLQADAGTRPATEIKGLFKRLPQHSADHWSPAQLQHSQALANAWNQRSPTSKALTAEYRHAFANSRSMIGFRPEWKEMIYPLHVTGGEGARVRDVDGHEYVDITMGFGVTLCGHGLPWVREAVEQELAAGNVMGPQWSRIGAVAAQLTAMTHTERAAFFTTGSEAVMVAVRLARAVTGRHKIVLFTNSYHGTFDGVLAAGWAQGERVSTFPVTDGTPQGMLDEVIVLRYGDPEALTTLQHHIQHLAAILVEPVQSREPSVQPAAFMHALRSLSAAHDVALIFDEMIMGFRLHPGGAQAYYGIEADLCTYGKVVGGGMPIGVVAGKARFLDAVDGGNWQYGDDSVPGTRTAFVAGTFNGHPCSMAAAEAMLEYLQAQGPQLQAQLNARTTVFANQLNAVFERVGAPIQVHHFGSLFRFDFQEHTELLNYHLLNNGVFVWEGRNCFLSTAHTEADLATIYTAVCNGLQAMDAAGWFNPPLRQPITPPDPQAHQHVPLLRGQQEMALLFQTQPEAASAYAEQVILRLDGPLDVGALERALSRLPERHALLRTVQIDPHTLTLLAALPVPLPVERISAEALEAALQRERNTPFAFEQGPLWRCRLFRLGAQQQVLALTVQHLIADGWSLGVLINELASLYAAETQQQSASLPPPATQEDFNAWSAQCQPMPIDPQPVPPLDLPVGADAQPAASPFAGARLQRRNPLAPTPRADAPEALYARIRQQARSLGVSPVVVSLAGYAAWLARLSGQGRFAIGLPYAGQIAAELPHFVGMASSILPVVVEVSGTQPFAELVSAVQQRLQAAQATASGLFAPQPAPTPAIQVLFNQDPRVNLQFAGLETDWVNPPLTQVKLDLFLNIFEFNDSVIFDFDYAQRLAGAETAARWLDGLFHLLDAACATPTTPIAELPLGPLTAPPPDAGTRLLDGLGGAAAIDALATPWQQQADGSWQAAAERVWPRADGQLTPAGHAERWLERPQGRVSLDQLSARLQALPDVAAAAVALEGERLVAFIQPAASATRNRLLRQISQQLRGPQRPDEICWVSEWPEGAADTIASPALSGERQPLQLGAAPRSATEQQIASLWREILGIQELGIEDDFFSLGGHSLKALLLLNRLEAMFGRQIAIHDFFSQPTIAGLAARLQQAAHTQAIAVQPQASHYPAAATQARLWLLEQLDPGNGVYHIGFVLHRADGFASEALHQALLQLQERHSLLRMALVEQDGQPWLQEGPALPPLLSSRPEADTATDEQAARLAFVSHPFALDQAPLWRLEQVQGTTGTALVVAMHHTITDQWSIGVFIRDLLALYQAAVSGAPARLPELPIQYPDYAHWQQAREQAPEALASEAYWQQQLAGPPPRLELPGNRPRPATPSGQGAYVRRVLPAALSERLRALAAEEGCSLFVLLTATFKLWLYQLSGERDLATATLHAGRDHPATVDLIGLFINTLILRDQLDPERSFSDWLAQVRQTVLAAFAHAITPFDRVVECVGAAQRSGRFPFSDVALVLEDGHDIARIVEAAGCEAAEIELPVTQFELTVLAVDRPDALELALQYATEVWDATTMQSWLDALIALLDKVSQHPAHRLSELSAPAPTVLDLWQQRVARNPHSLAVQDAQQRYTTAEVDAQVMAIAAHLQAAGAGPETLVGLCLERQADLLPALLGILRAGAGVLPIDPELPRARIAYLLEDSGCRWAIVDATTQASLDGLPITTLPLASLRTPPPSSNPLPPLPNPLHLAYVIYTSGSTGQPKGVAIEHGALTASLQADQAALAFPPGTGCMAFASVVFDAAWAQLLSPLLSEGWVYIAQAEERQDPEVFWATVRQHQIHVLDLPPAFWGECLDYARQSPEAVRDLHLHALLIGGEAMPPAYVQAWAELPLRCDHLYNIYGPTETVIDASIARITPEQAQAGRALPIGQALGPRRLQVRDTQGQPLPSGQPGELWISTLLARGYLGQPALTAQRFVYDADGERWYRSGDQARIDADGQCHFLGRLDQQVKLRGLRIELTEIEAHLATHPALAAAAVAVVPGPSGAPQDQQLIAWIVVKTGTSISAAMLREHLRTHLPAYMLPNQFRRIARLPMNISGKLDRSALANEPVLDTLAPPESAPLDPASTHPTPASASPDPATVVDARLQAQLCAIIAEVLGLPGTRPQDNFFEIGGHSLKATQAVARIHRQLGVKLALKTFFAAPTLAELATAIAAAQPVAPPPQTHIPLAPRQELLPVSFAQRRLWLVQNREPDTVAYNMVAAFRIHGTLDPEALARAFDALIQRHEILRTRLISQGGLPYQRILPSPGGFVLRQRNVSDLEAAIAEQAQAERQYAFDLAEEPLLRALLLNSADPSSQDWALILNLHHVAFDGWSTSVFCRELAALYAAAQAQPQLQPGQPLEQAARLAPLPLQYADYAAWQNDPNTRPNTHSRAYWLSQFEDLPAPLDWPVEQPRPPRLSGQGQLILQPLAPATSRGLRALAQAEGVSLFAVLTSLVLLQVQVLSRQTDVVLGTPVAGRETEALEGQIGFYLNMLPLRLAIAPDPQLPFRALLQATGTPVLEALSHQDYPFDRLIEDLAPTTPNNRHPLFDVILILQNIDPVVLPLANLKTQTVTDASVSAKYDLNYMVEEDATTLELQLEYATDLFSATEAQRIAGDWVALATQVANAPDTPLATLRAQLAASWPQLSQPNPAAAPVVTPPPPLTDEEW